MSGSPARLFLACAVGFALPWTTCAGEQEREPAAVPPPGETAGGEDGGTGPGGEEKEDSLEIDAETTGLKEAPPQPEADEDVTFAWGIRWEHGIHFELTQKLLFPGHEYFPWRHQDYRKLVGRMGVKLHVDAAAFDEGGKVAPIPAGAELRRFRLYALGNTYFIRPLDFKVEFGISGNEFFFSEGYVRWNDVGWVSTVQAGQFNSPMSLEMMNSSGMSVFMERGSPVLAFAPGSRLGLQIGGPFRDERMTLTAGVFANVATLDIGDATEKAAGPIGRFTVVPIRGGQGDGGTILHLGASASYSDSRKDAFQYRSRPESYVAPYAVDTGEMRGSYATIYGLEAALVRGPWTFQAEHLHSHVDRYDGADATFMGTYGYLSYFITGESRPYNANKGLFSRPLPGTNFSMQKRTWGAWEAALRASYVDLSDQDIRGGRMTNLSGGLNWYFNRDDRLMLNYVYSDIDDTDAAGHLHILQLRVQFEY